MSDKLFTVDVESGSTKLIPVTLDEFRADLMHPISKVYVYVGNEQDAGWDAALATAGTLAALHPYLATDIGSMRAWVPGGEPRGVVFGTDDQPDRLLDAGEAAVFKIVLNANAEAP